MCTTRMRNLFAIETIKNIRESNAKKTCVAGLRLILHLRWDEINQLSYIRIIFLKRMSRVHKKLTKIISFSTLFYKKQEIWLSGFFFFFHMFILKLSLYCPIIFKHLLLLPKRRIFSEPRMYSVFVLYERIFFQTLTSLFKIISVCLYLRV